MDMKKRLNLLKILASPIFVSILIDRQADNKYCNYTPKLAKKSSPEGAAAVFDTAAPVPDPLDDPAEPVDATLFILAVLVVRLCVAVVVEAVVVAVVLFVAFNCIPPLLLLTLL